MYPILVILLDGLADRAHPELGGRTGNEAATTPNLDRLALEGSCGVIYAVGPGRAPSSEVAHWSMLGYRPDEFPGRAVFEALGHGQEVNAEYAFAFAALRPAERREDGLWLTGRPRYGEDEEDAAALVDACAHLEVDGLGFSLAARPPRRGDPPRPGTRPTSASRIRTPSSATAIRSCARSRWHLRPSRPRAAAAKWTQPNDRGPRAASVNAERGERGLPKR